MDPSGSALGDMTQTVSAQDPSDRAGRDPDAQLAQLTLDANASPASVLSTVLNNEPDQFIAHRRATRPLLSSPTSPFVLGRLPMPPQQRLWGDHESSPPVSREQPAEYSEDRPVRWPIFDASVKLALENTDLVPEHHDLNVPPGLGPSTPTTRRRGGTNRGRGERRAHRMMPVSAANFQFMARSDYWCPSALPRDPTASSGRRDGALR
jgi:hypothetical protein